MHPKSHPSRPLLLTTTDVRTPKVTQLLQNSAVELCWYLSPPPLPPLQLADEYGGRWIDGSQEQFRIAARAILVPAPSDAMHDAYTAKLASFADGKFAPGEIDWEAKRRALFDDMSGHMKASWVRPTPGTPMPGGGGYDEAKKWPERLPKIGEAKDEKEKRLVEEALRNFALVVLDPLDVDYVELGIVPNQRTRFVKKDDDWEETILVP